MSEEGSIIIYLITGLLLCVPFGIGWYLLFRLIKKDIRTALGFSFLILCTVIALMAYFGFCMFVSPKIGGQLRDLIMMVAYASE